MLTLAESEKLDEKAASDALQAGQLSYGITQSINSTSTTNLQQSVDIYEKEMIEKALEESKGNKNRAAKKLNLTRQALQYKLKKYGLGHDENM